MVEVQLVQLRKELYCPATPGKIEVQVAVPGVMPVTVMVVEHPTRTVLFGEALTTLV
jgi:hypothetical protein